MLMPSHQINSYYRDFMSRNVLFLEEDFLCANKTKLEEDQRRIKRADRAIVWGPEEDLEATKGCIRISRLVQRH